MPKLAEKTFMDNVEFPTFDASKANDQFRAFAEKGVEQSKEAYARMKTGAEEAQKVIESTLETAKTVSGDLSLKTISAMRANADLGFSHFEQLLSAKTFSEVIELQTSFLRKRVELSLEQAKDFQAATTKAVEDVAKPMKAVFEKSLGEMKAA